MNNYKIRAYFEIIAYIAMLLCIIIDLLFSIIFGLIALIQIIKNCCKEETKQKQKLLSYKEFKEVQKDKMAKKIQQGNNRNNKKLRNLKKNSSIPSKNQPNSRKLQIRIRPTPQNTEYNEENQNNPKENDKKSNEIEDNPHFPPNYQLTYPNFPPRNNDPFTEEIKNSKELENQKDNYAPLIDTNKILKKPRINYVNPNNFPLKQSAPRSKIINEIKRDRNPENLGHQNLTNYNNINPDYNDPNNINRILKNNSKNQLPLKKNEKSPSFFEELNKAEITKENKSFNRVETQIFQNDINQIRSNFYSPRKNPVIIRINPEDKRIEYSRLNLTNSSPYTSNIANIVNNSLNQFPIPSYASPVSNFHPTGKIFKNF